MKGLGHYKRGPNLVRPTTREVRRPPNLPTFDAELPKRPTRPFVPPLCERARAPYYLARVYRFTGSIAHRGASIATASVSTTVVAAQPGLASSAQVKNKVCPAGVWV